MRPVRHAAELVGAHHPDHRPASTRHRDTGVRRRRDRADARARALPRERSDRPVDPLCRPDAPAGAEAGAPAPYRTHGSSQKAIHQRTLWASATVPWIRRRRAPHEPRSSERRFGRDRGPVIAPGGGGQLTRNPHVTADNSRRQKHSTSSKPASRSALSSTSSGKYRSSSDHAAKWPRACASVMP